MYRLITKIVLDECVAQDLTQDTFVKASSKIEQFQGNASFKTWLCRIAVNDAHQHLRKVITARKHMETYGAGAEHRGGMASPRDSLFWKEENRRITEAIKTLAPELRSALVLTVIEGMNPQEAARIQGCTRSTLYWRVHQARKILKKELGHA